VLPRLAATAPLPPVPLPSSAEPPAPSSRRCAIVTTSRTPRQPNAQAREFADGYPPEDAILQVARGLAHEVGLVPVAPGTGAALRLLAAAVAARAVVEIGTGTGVSSLWLLRGMRAEGVLTTIDAEAEHQRMARRAFAEAGFAPSRTRIITGRALDVLPRLADGAYDLIFVDGEAAEHEAGIAAALRLLRPGGILAVNGALAGGRIADPAARDAETAAVREMVKALREAEEWVPALLPVGDGLLAAVKR
jgi:predicted O-methyltransferase YrrM